MDFSGSFTVEAPSGEVYAFITDAVRMATIIPDVQSFEAIDSDNYRMIVKVGLSFIKGRFNLKIRTAEKVPPSHAEIHGSGTGSGSSASFKGICDIKPVSEGSCLVDWRADVEIGGLAASVGSRLVRGASEKYLAQLIESFKDALKAGSKSAP